MEISNTLHALPSSVKLQGPRYSNKPQEQATADTKHTAESKNASETTNASTQEQNKPTENLVNNAKDKLTQEQIQEVEKLKQRDREVRAHEAAHLAAAGQYATGGPTFTYQRGPDGKNYSVGGEVSIDTSKINGDPGATIQKARQIRSAALAPAEPSAQDRSVAAEAAKMEAEARAELQQQQMQERKTDSTENTDKGEKPDKDTPTSAYQAIASFDPDKTISIFNLTA